MPPQGVGGGHERACAAEFWGMLKEAPKEAQKGIPFIFLACRIGGPCTVVLVLFGCGVGIDRERMGEAVNLGDYE